MTATWPGSMMGGDEYVWDVNGNRYVRTPTGYRRDGETVVVQEPIAVYDVASPYATWVPGPTYTYTTTAGTTSYDNRWVPVSDHQSYSDWVRRQQEYEAEYRRRIEEQRENQKQAWAKATELLTAWMTPAQRKTYKNGQYFMVKSSTGRKWRINCNSTTGNCYLMDEGAYYCASVPGVPPADTFLTQALTIMTDERKFMRIANRYTS